jgi:hypothetical protein
MAMVVIGHDQASSKKGVISSQKPGSLQPMHGCPASTGQLVPSLNLAMGQLL